MCWVSEGLAPAVLQGHDHARINHHREIEIEISSRTAGSGPEYSQR